MPTVVSWPEELKTRQKHQWVRKSGTKQTHFTWCQTQLLWNEDLSAERSKLGLEAGVDTPAKTSWGDQSTHGLSATPGCSASRALGCSQGNVTTPIADSGSPVSVCSLGAPHQLGSVCNAGFSPSPAVSITGAPNTGDLTAALGASRSLHEGWCLIPCRQTHTSPETCEMLLDDDGKAVSTHS